MSDSKLNPDTASIVLRDVSMSDLPLFFEYQLDEEANRMAAFTPKNPADKDAFDAKWSRILANESTTTQTILYEGQVAGSVSCYIDEDGHPVVTYWIGKSYWGKGITTGALSAFLQLYAVRPVYASAAKDNIASLRVLEKCGFTRIGENRGFANARGKEIEEVILRLD